MRSAATRSPKPCESSDRSNREARMTANVTSIARVRNAARRREESTAVNRRLIAVLLVTVVVLLVIGLGELMSASSIRGFADAADQFFYFKRQMVGLAIGLVVLVAAIRIRYQTYKSLAMPFFLVSLAGLVAVKLIGLAAERLDQRGSTWASSRFSHRRFPRLQ